MGFIHRWNTDNNLWILHRPSGGCELKMNKKIVGIGITLTIFFIFFNYALANHLYKTLPYCITHACGITHNFGIADAIWMMMPAFIAFTFIISIGTIHFGYSIT